MTKDFENDLVAPGTREPQQQLAFDSLPAGEDNNEAADGKLGAANRAATAGRLLFPTNREDILLHLSSLAISRDFPAGLTVVAVQDDALALLPDGLRVDEASLLQNGRTGRFPVLVDLRQSVRGQRGWFGIDEIAALCFRSQADADDFRFRPVDEFDTGAVTCRVEPALFDLPGVARFRSSPPIAPESQDQGSFSDRIAGGICSVLELGAIEPRCWHDIADLLCRPHAAASSHEVTLARALASGYAPVSDGGQAEAVLRAFIAHAAGESSTSLVARVHAHLVDGNEAPGQLNIAERWSAVASAVLQNRAQLDGQLLSDERSVALRATLLASVVDDVRALIPFMRAPRPAGRKVIVTAAFLIGLRSGITDMPWSLKRTRLSILSPLIVGLREAAPEARERVRQAFQFEPDETSAGVVLRLFWNDHELAYWKPHEAEVAPDSAAGDAGSVIGLRLEPRSDTAGNAEASVVCGTGASESDAPKCIRSADGRLIELLRLEPSGQRGVTMRCTLSETDRLRKPKEILEIACTGGLLWRAGISVDGVEALYADLLQWPDDAMLAQMSESLARALDAYLVKKKVRASAGSSGRGKAAGRKSETKAAQLPPVDRTGGE